MFFVFDMKFVQAYHMSVFMFQSHRSLHVHLSFIKQPIKTVGHHSLIQKKSKAAFAEVILLTVLTRIENKCLPILEFYHVCFSLCRLRHLF